MLAGLIGAFLLYIIMATSSFVMIHMVMSRFFDIRDSIAVPVAFVAGVFFPITIALLVVCFPIILIIWYVRNIL